MSFDTIVKGGTVVTAADSFVADVGIQGETIVALGQDLASRRHRCPCSLGATLLWNRLRR